MSDQHTEVTDGPLRAEFDFYLANQDSLVARYDGKVVVLKGRQVIGAYDDELAALTSAKKEHELGTFLIQRVSAGDRDYTLTFQSRVAFP